MYLGTYPRAVWRFHSRIADVKRTPIMNTVVIPFASNLVLFPEHN